MNSSDAIEVAHLRRSYQAAVGILGRHKKEIVAVDDISFSVSRGELFGLLGPNGAGKTTTVKVLTTLLVPSSGSARVVGMDVVRDAQAVRKRIGFVLGGERGLYGRLSGRNNLRYFAELYGVAPSVSRQRIDHLLDLVGLGDRATERVEGYSRGMKQRLHIARALIHDPEVLFLDEPTIGLDPVGARELRSTVANLISAKKTILLTTHYMFEAESLCNRIAVINHGRIIALDTPAGLKGTVSDLAVLELEMSCAEASAIERLRYLPGVQDVSWEERGGKKRITVQTPLGSAAVPRVVEALASCGGLEKVLVREPSLEDAYVRLVGGESVTK